MKQLYGDDIYPVEKIVTRTPKYSILNRKISDVKTLFNSLLFANDEERLGDLGDIELQRFIAYAFENFERGVLMIKVLDTPPVYIEE